MTTAGRVIPSAGETTARADRPAASLRFDTAAVVLAGWFIFGMFLDGWAHNHGRVDDTFLTPWHAVLYSGYAAFGLLMVGTHFRNVMKGYAWSRALPAGYMPALVGVLIFGVAGASDFLWHNLFGFEANMEALLSPAHLALATGAFLFLTGTVRAYWMRAKQPQTWREALPLVLSLTFVVSLLTFFVQYASMTGNTGGMTGFRPDPGWAYDLRGVVGVLIHTALLVGMTMFVNRRWNLPFGAFTLMYTLNLALMVWLMVRVPAEYLLILTGLIGGLTADGLMRWLKPSAERPLQLRLFAIVVPFVTTLAFFMLMNQVGMMLEGRGLWWHIHMWLGAPFTAGIGGYLLSLLLVPPAIPVEKSA